MSKVDRIAVLRRKKQEEGRKRKQFYSRRKNPLDHIYRLPADVVLAVLHDSYTIRKLGDSVIMNADWHGFQSKATFDSMAQFRIFLADVRRVHGKRKQ